MSHEFEIVSQWQGFIQKWQTLAQQKGFPEIEHDSDWPSPCEFEQNNTNCWQPLTNNDSLSFENVEQAIGYSLNEEFKQFFVLFYSENLLAKHEHGNLQYLQAWSKTDFERLQQNLIGHLMMKGRLKQSPTLFFAVTDEEDLNLVVDNETGEVALEYVGKEPHKLLAKSLAEFISATQPVLVGE